MRAAILAAIVLAFSVSHASAVSLAVKLACADDYYAHCSMHAPDSPGVRACMRAVGRNLSQRCISALRDAGEIKQTRVASAKSRSVRTAAPAPAAKKVYASKSNPKMRLAQKATAKRHASKDTGRRHEADRRIARREHEYRVARN